MSLTNCLSPSEIEPLKLDKPSKTNLPVAGQRETGRQNANDEHGYQPTHPTRVTYEYRAVIRG